MCSTQHPELYRTGLDHSNKQQQKTTTATAKRTTSFTFVRGQSRPVVLLQMCECESSTTTSVETWNHLLTSSPPLQLHKTLKLPPKFIQCVPNDNRHLFTPPPLHSSSFSLLLLLVTPPLPGVSAPPEPNNSWTLLTVGPAVDH